MPSFPRSGARLLNQTTVAMSKDQAWSYTWVEEGENGIVDATCEANNPIEYCEVGVAKEEKDCRMNRSMRIASRTLEREDVGPLVALPSSSDPGSTVCICITSRAVPHARSAAARTIAAAPRQCFRRFEHGTQLVVLVQLCQRVVGLWNWGG
jgi:hypothetical protein